MLIRNLALIGQAVSEKKIFENVNAHMQGCRLENCKIVVGDVFCLFVDLESRRQEYESLVC